MPKKKEPTRTPVNKDPKKTTQPALKAVEKPATPAPTTPVKAEITAQPVAPTPAPTASVKAEAPPPPTSAKVEAPKPAAPAKAETIAQPAEKPAPAKTTKSSKTPAAPAKVAAKRPVDSTATVVVAKYDVGFGNKLFIRGEGAGLGWEAGVEMKNVENDVWVWTTNDLTEGALACKFLINDDIWSTGENLFVPAGETSTVFPSF